MKIGNRRSRRIIIDQLPNIFGVKASSMTVPPGTNACAKSNGGCSHLCLYTPRVGVTNQFMHKSALVSSSL